jgi:hypothetical protein
MPPALNADACMEKGRKSAFPGVSWATHARKWRAQLRVGDCMKNLGYFAEEADAARAVAAARAARPELRLPPEERLPPEATAEEPPLLPGVSWRDGRWRVRGLPCGGFATRGEAELACRRKPRVRAMRRTEPWCVKWEAAATASLLERAPFKDMGTGISAPLRLALKARWAEEQAAKGRGGAGLGAAARKRSAPPAQDTQGCI